MFATFIWIKHSSVLSKSSTPSSSSCSWPDVPPMPSSLHLLLIVVWTSTSKLLGDNSPRLFIVDSPLLREYDLKMESPTTSNRCPQLPTPVSYYLNMIDSIGASKEVNKLRNILKLFGYCSWPIQQWSKPNNWIITLLNFTLESYLLTWNDESFSDTNAWCQQRYILEDPSYQTLHQQARFNIRSM